MVRGSLRSQGFVTATPDLEKLDNQDIKTCFLPVKQDLSVDEEGNDDPHRRVVVVDDGVVGQEGDQEDVKENWNGFKADRQPGFLT